MYQTYSWKGKLSSREKGQKVILHIETWSWRQNTALQKCLPWPLGDIPWPSGLCRMWWRSQTSGQGGHPGPNLITRVLRNREICLPGVRKMQKQEEREMRSSRHSNCCCCWERRGAGAQSRDSSSAASARRRTFQFHGDWDWLPPAIHPHLQADPAPGQAGADT